MKFIFTALLFIASHFCFAQIHFTQKVFAFVQRQGDETKHFIYIKMHGDSIPIWDSAIIEGKKYVVHSTLVETLPYQVGTRKSDKRLVSIKADPDTKMYVLDFDATGEVESTPDPKNKNAAIVLTTRIMGRKITYKILTEVELE